MANHVVKPGNVVFPWGGGGREARAGLEETAADRQRLCYWISFALTWSFAPPCCSNSPFAAQVFRARGKMVQEVGGCQPLHRALLLLPASRELSSFFCSTRESALLFPEVSRDGSSKNDALSRVLSLQVGGVMSCITSRRSLPSPSTEAPGYLWGTSQRAAFLLIYALDVLSVVCKKDYKACTINLLVLIQWLSCAKAFYCYQY